MMPQKKMTVQSISLRFTERHQIRRNQFQIWGKVKRYFVVSNQRLLATANKTRFAPQKVIANLSPPRRTASTRWRFAFEPFG